MPTEWPTEKWDELRANHLELMNDLGKDGWEYFMNIGPLFYFKRLIEKPVPIFINGIPLYEQGYGD